MARGDDTFRREWSKERLPGKRTDFHTMQQALRKRDDQDREQEDDWFFHAPPKEEVEEAEET